MQQSNEDLMQEIRNIVVAHSNYNKNYNENYHKLYSQYNKSYPLSPVNISGGYNSILKKFCEADKLEELLYVAQRIFLHNIIKPKVLIEKEKLQQESINTSKNTLEEFTKPHIRIVTVEELKDIFKGEQK